MSWKECSVMDERLRFVAKLESKIKLYQRIRDGQAVLDVGPVVRLGTNPGPRDSMKLRVRSEFVVRDSRLRGTDASRTAGSGHGRGRQKQPGDRAERLLKSGPTARRSSNRRVET